MASRFLQVLLSATVVAFIAVGCGNRGFNPPSDEDMIHNFYAHEDAFNEITEILLNCPYGDIYPPFYPIGSATDSLYGHEIEMYTVEQGEKRDKRQ